MMFNFLKPSLNRWIRPKYLNSPWLRHCLCSRTSSSYPVYRIRKATPNDVPVILKFLTDLAVFEKQPVSSLRVSEKDLLRDGFGDRQYFHCLIPEYVTTDKVIPIGFTIYYFTYSTWKGRRVLHVDDLYVEPEYRGKGVATLFKNEICKVAAANDCHRIQWLVFDWNEEAFAMYEKWGSKRVPEYVVCEMPRETLLKHASNDDLDDDTNV
ncbi:thialysine N-epsilon-acetyltransferase-like [Dysidea avara]|uniref:thialysine N-epsilon-acetyltransferase-like n=1 Tax=Dysidea avara TaxID=196820 RepID=UPI0033290E66